MLPGEGADINAFSPLGTALFSESCSGHPDVVETLLDAGAKISEKKEKNENGETTLMMAAEEGYSDIVKAPIHKDCDINVEDRCGYAVMKSGREKGGEDIMQMLAEAGAIE